MTHSPMKSKLGLVATVATCVVAILSVLFDTTPYLWVMLFFFLAIVAWLDWVLDRE